MWRSIASRPASSGSGPDKDLLQMLRSGELDAAIYGANLPNDPMLKSVIPIRIAAAAKWYAQHKVVPINHMVVITEELARSNPVAVREVYRLLVESKRAAGLPKAGAIDFLPFGLEACRPALLIADQVFVAAEACPANPVGHRRAFRRQYPCLDALKAFRLSGPRTRLDRPSWKSVRRGNQVVMLNFPINFP